MSDPIHIMAALAFFFLFVGLARAQDITWRHSFLVTIAMFGLSGGIVAGVIWLQFH